MNTRERIAWIIAAAALLLCGMNYWMSDRWYVREGKRGVFRVNQRTGETYQLVRQQWVPVREPGQ